MKSAGKLHSKKAKKAFVLSLSLAGLTLTTLPVWADVAGDWSSMSDIAKSANANMGTTVNAWINTQQNNGYKDLPGYTNDPSQKGYYNDPTKMNADVVTQYQSNTNAQNVVKQFNTGSQYQITKDTPMVQTGDAVQSNIDAIMQGTYPGCNQSESCKTDQTFKSCQYSRSEALNCTNTLQATVTWTPLPQCYHLSGMGDGPSFAVGPDAAGNCIAGIYTAVGAGGDVHIHQSLPVAIDVPPGAITVVAGRNRDSGADIAVKSELNGVAASVTDGDGYAQNQANTTVQNSANTLNITIDGDRSDGGGYFAGWGYVEFKNQQIPTTTTNWVNSCTNIPGFCAMQKETCTDTTNPKVINGLPVTESCWQYAQNYTCTAPVTNSCDQYQGSCNEVSSTCSGTYLMNGVCLQYNETFACPIKTCSAKLVCGMKSFCINGDCYEANPTQNKNFGKDDAEFAAISAAGQSLSQSGDALRAFTGEPMSCRKTVLDYINCCSDSGWGKDTGLSNCNAQEKELGEIKQKGPNENWDNTTVEGRAVYVGDYCSKKVAGICIEHSEGYCVFNDLIATDVQVQGRKAQMGLDFGSSDAPDCSGLSADSLQKIDFGQIDFTNIEQQIEGQATFPQSQETQQNILEHLKEMGGTSS